MKEEVNEKDKISDLEIEEYFKDAKKKGFPIGILVLIFILLFIGGICFYYFVIDSPKNIVFEMGKNIYSNFSSYDYEYNSFKIDGEYNFISNNSDDLDVINILNKISFEGEFDIDYDKDEIYTYLDILYNNNSLINVDSYVVSNSLYIKSENIFDRVIKVDVNDDIVESSDMDSTYEELIKICINDIIKSFNDIKYYKRYKKVDNSYVKEIMFSIDKYFLEDLYGYLLNDKEFIQKYSLLNDISEAEVKDRINKEINDIDDDYIDIVIDLSVLSNEFIKLEILSDDERIVIDREDDVYYYKYYDSSIIMYQGSIKVSNIDNSYKYEIVIDLVEEDVLVELSLNIVYYKLDDIPKVDDSNTIMLDEMSEEDHSKIINNISNNQVLRDLLNDLYG